MLLGAAVGVVRETLIWDQRVSLDGPIVAASFTIGVPILIAGLVLLATRKRSRASFFLLLVLTALAWWTSWHLGLSDGTPAYTAGAASLILQSAGLAAMLLPAGRRWLFPQPND